MTVHELIPERYHTRDFDRIGTFESFPRFFQEMDRLWDEAFTGMPFGSLPMTSHTPWFGTPWFNRTYTGFPTTSHTPWFGDRKHMMPGLDMTEKGDTLEIWVDLPGMEVKDVSVTLTDGFLTITGERKDEKEEKDRSFFRTERRFGTFFRRVALPYEVEADRIVAEFHNGVLKIVLPKSQKAKAGERHIEVKAA